jgi:hypothetical protein
MAGTEIRWLSSLAPKNVETRADYVTGPEPAAGPATSPDRLLR